MAHLNILVVDDEFSVRESLLVWLKKSGYRVAGAGSGKEALAMLDQAPFDIVLLDIKMPGMDGIEVLRLIKANYPRTMVVMMTAYASIESAVDAMKAGAGDYLMKPLRPRPARSIDSSAYAFSRAHGRKYAAAGAVDAGDQVRELYRPIGCHTEGLSTDP
ncbi:MAG: response regulator [Syntrophobacteraceae bacterium]